MAGLVAAAAEDRTTYAFTSVPDGLVGTTRYLDIDCWYDDAPSVVEVGHTWLAASVQRTAVTPPRSSCSSGTPSTPGGRSG